jgi:hypothetical protein
MTSISLEYPVTVEGREVAEISLRRPRVNDVVASRKGKKDDADAEVALIANLAGLPPSAILDLDLSDYKKLQEAIGDFFG